MELERGRRGHVADAALALGGLVYSGVLAILSFQYAVEARVFALVAAVAGITTSLAYLVSAARAYLVEPVDRVSDPDEQRESAARRTLLAVSGLIVASIPVLYLFGVYVYGFAFVLVFLRFFGRHAWRTTLAMASALSVFNYLLFTVVFDLRFDTVGILLP